MWISGYQSIRLLDIRGTGISIREGLLERRSSLVFRISLVEADFVGN
ncbi:MAG: hypothetical protein ACYTBV_08595 [Planctomycetota bacterium]